MKKEIAKKSNDHHLKLSSYYIYIIECENGSLYTGITTDINRRFEEHKGKRIGAKYTRAFKAKKIVSAWKTKRCKNSKSIALKLEIGIKKLKRSEKLKLIEDNTQFNVYFGNLFTDREIARVL